VTAKQGPPDGGLILAIAEKYGRPPEEVETWDAYWFNRAVEAHIGEGLNNARKAKELAGKR
jgi:hypothetical protein